MSFRFPPDKKVALTKAAEEDSRSLTSMIDKILTDWLKANGYLKPRGKTK